MRLVKLALFGVLVVGLGAVWVNRLWVVDAYRTDRAAQPVRLSGVDLAYRATEIEPSPFSIPRAPDTRSSPSPVVLDGATTPPPATPSLQGGSARLQGTVVGPDGPVEGAVVRIERHTSAGVVGVDVLSDQDGGWQIGPLAGGRYRVRSWVPGLLTMTRSEVRFVADDEVADFAFTLAPADPTPGFEFVHAGPLYDDVPGTVAVVLSWKSIDQEGLVVTNPVPGAEVTIHTTAQVEVVSPQPVLTDGAGAARVQLRCIPTGWSPQPAATASPTPTPAPAVGPAGTLTATSGQIGATFALPGCQPVPPPAPEPATADGAEVPTDG